MSSLSKAAENALRVCMNLEKADSLLIVYDKKKEKIAKALLNESKKISPNSKSLKIKEPKVNGEEPSKNTAKEMLKYDVIMLVTSKSLSHTKARRDASKKGARITSMPGITEDMFIRTMKADYYEVEKKTNKLAKVLKKGKKVRIITKKGTNITMGIKGRKLFFGCLCNKKGSFHNLPSGETCLAPLECTTNGVLIVDASMAGVGKVSSLKIIVKDGFAVDIIGKKSGKLKKVLDSVKDKNAYAIAELGIGTNDKAKITGKILEDEKVLGTAHIALGNNKSYGGKIDVPIHIDGVFRKPTIWVDNKKIMDNGKLLI